MTPVGIVMNGIVVLLWCHLFTLGGQFLVVVAAAVVVALVVVLLVVIVVDDVYMLPVDFSRCFVVKVIIKLTSTLY